MRPINKIILACILAATLISPYLVFAETAPTQIAPGSGTDVSDYVFELLTYDTYLFFASNFYADAVYIHGSHVNFTNTSIGSASTMVHDFGLGVDDGNATVTDVDASFVTVAMDCTPSAVCYAFYYYDDDHIPYTVQTVVDGNMTVIPLASYFTNNTLFNSAPTPAVYQNTTGDFLKVKITFEDPSTITFASGSFIYADAGGVTEIGTITLHFPNPSGIPKAADIYGSNDGEEWTLLKANHQFLQQSGFQTVNFPDVFAQFIKIEITDWGSASSIRMSEFDISDPEGAAVSDNAESAFGSIWIFYTVIGSVIIVAVVKFMLPRFGYEVI